MRASLIIPHALLTLPFLGLVSLASADDHLKFWIDSSCKTPSVQAINEARWLSKQMSEQLGNQDLDTFKSPLDWFFHIKPDDRGIIDFIRKTYARIGAVERVVDRKDAKLRIYCDNQNGFVPEDGSQAPPDGSDQFKKTAFKWNQEEVVGMGEELHCRSKKAHGATTNSAEEFWKKRGNQPSGKLPSDRIVMWICDHSTQITKFTPTTTETIKNIPPDKATNAVFLMVQSWTALHEFAHVNALSSQQYHDDFTDVSLAHGVDYFRSGLANPNSPLLSGYYEPGNIPGHVLNFPFHTVVNPDSYAPFALAWQFRQKQYELIQQNPFVEDLRYKKNTNLPVGPDPDWSKDSRPGNTWDFSNDPTPDGHV